MKATRLLKILFLVAVFSCTKTEYVNYCVEFDRKEGPVPFRSVEEVSGDTLHCWARVIDTTYYFEPVLFLIDNQAAFDSLVECDFEDVQPNFEGFTLLIGPFFTIGSSAPEQS